MPVRTTALIPAFMPGASPPEVNTAIFFISLIFQKYRKFVDFFIKKSLKNAVFCLKCIDAGLKIAYIAVDVVICTTWGNKNVSRCIDNDVQRLRIAIEGRRLKIAVLFSYCID